MPLEELYVMRHGETDWNASLRMQGHQDIPLNEAGLAQARAVAPSVARLRPDVVVSSDLQRTLVTAHVIADLIGQPVQAPCADGSWPHCGHRPAPSP